VATAVGGIPELFEGDAGLLAPASDSKAIAARVMELVCDTTRRETIVANARAKVKRNNDIETVVTQYLSLLGLPPYWNGAQSP
jgi:glycosyltransferase involved in cell wall biosynthesis